MEPLPSAEALLLPRDMLRHRCDGPQGRAPRGAGGSRVRTRCRDRLYCDAESRLLEGTCQGCSSQACSTPALRGKCQLCNSLVS